MILNPITGQLERSQAVFFRGVFAEAPSGAHDGWMYVNSGDNNLYIYYGGVWTAIIELPQPVVGRYLGFGAFTFAG